MSGRPESRNWLTRPLPPSPALLASCSKGQREPSLPASSVLPTQVRLQTQTTYRGIVDCMVKTYRHESVGGLLLWGLWGGRHQGQSVSSSFLPCHPLAELCPWKREDSSLGQWGAG